MDGALADEIAALGAIPTDGDGGESAATASPALTASLSLTDALGV
jgi:hypothetical protein